MKFINKGHGEFHYLNHANKNLPTTADEAISRWKSFRRHKTHLMEELKEEQYGLCAYSEIRPDEAGLSTHIEHVEPKGDNPLRTFDYQNLVLSALSSDDLKGRPKDQVFGGHVRTKPNDMEKFISPLQTDCSRYFTYSSFTGEVAPAHTLSNIEKAKVHYTIKELNLNCAYLVSQRKAWIRELEDLIDEHLENRDSLVDLASIYLTPTSGKLDPFFSASKQRFGRIAEEVLQ